MRITNEKKTINNLISVLNCISLLDLQAYHFLTLYYCEIVITTIYITDTSSRLIFVLDFQLIFTRFL